MSYAQVKELIDKRIFQIEDKIKREQASYSTPDLEKFKDLSTLSIASTLIAIQDSIARIEDTLDSLERSK